MVGARGPRQLIVQHLAASALDQLLQLRLIVPAALLHHLLTLLVQQDAVDEVAGGVHPAVQIHGGKYGLGGVGQYGGPAAAAALLLALAQQQIIAQVQGLGHLVQALLTHQGGADAGQVALRQLRVLFEQVLGGHKAQHGVAQEFQALVAAYTLAAVLVGVGAVVQGGTEQLRVAEGVAQLFFQFFHRNLLKKYGPAGPYFLSL